MTSLYRPECAQVPGDAWPMPGFRPDSRAGRIRKAIGMSSGLLWLGFPIADFISADPSALRIAVVSFVALTFSVVYVGEALRHAATGPKDLLAFVAILLVSATFLSLYDKASWSTMYVFTVVASGLRLPSRWAARVLIVSVALSVFVCLVNDGSDYLISIAATTAGIGALFMAFGRLIATNIELTKAREELAEKAVDEERLRFARDLHDLLGHSLSVIALKAELAERLLPADPETARKHAGDVRDVARAALSDVREAVSGYRKPTVRAELAGARVALEAAGIEAKLADPDELGLEPDSEAVLAWAIREGTTNIIRHSGARNVTIALAGDVDGVWAAEIIDDGLGSQLNDHVPGQGLAGLRERAAAVAGAVEAGPAPGGGYRLRVSVPVTMRADDQGPDRRGSGDGPRGARSAARPGT